MFVSILPNPDFHRFLIRPLLFIVKSMGTVQTQSHSNPQT